MSRVDPADLAGRVSAAFMAGDVDAATALLVEWLPHLDDVDEDGWWECHNLLRERLGGDAHAALENAYIAALMERSAALPGREEDEAWWRARLAYGRKTERAS